MTLRKLLEQAVIQFGSQTAAAKAIAVDPSRFNKVLHGRSEYESFEVGTCLRLAKALGRSPSEVLGLAGKAEEASLIREMFGTEHPLVLTVLEMEMINTLRATHHRRGPGVDRDHIRYLAGWVRFFGQAIMRQVTSLKDLEHWDADVRAEAEWAEEPVLGNWDPRLLKEYPENTPNSLRDAVVAAEERREIEPHHLVKNTVANRTDRQQHVERFLQVAQDATNLINAVSQFLKDFPTLKDFGEYDDRRVATFMKWHQFREFADPGNPQERILADMLNAMMELIDKQDTAMRKALQRRIRTDAKGQPRVKRTSRR